MTTQAADRADQVGASPTTGPLTAEQTEQFHRDGYVIARGLIPQAEVEALREEFMAAAHAGFPGDNVDPKPDPARADDPLNVYPRMLQPHLSHDSATRYLLDPRVTTIITQLLGEEPLAAQSMFYFKPPGARGQSLHQDNFYLRVEPGTCIAAWMACDVVDRANGGLEVVPGTHAMEVFCPEEADQSVSFTRDYVPPPPGLPRVPVDMQPGDVLFFNGSLVHGSAPNSTTDRFRRSFICHYAPATSEAISTYYPTMTLAGQRVHLPEAAGGGPCGDLMQAPSAPH